MMAKPTIVLLRGMFGVARFLWWEYSHGAPKMLQDMGFTVLIPALPWGEPVAVRGAFLAGYLKDIPGPLHLVAHSMGGIDARRYITHLGGHEKVVSLTTLSSPHRGSILAAQAMASPFSPWRHIHSVADLTPAAMDRFNAATPDMPGVIYRSYSAARPLCDQPWWVRPYGRQLTAAEGANDSQVSVTSAVWGEHVASLSADHYELIGSHFWLNPFRRRPPFDHLQLFRDIGLWIQQEAGKAPTGT
ncbi:MAG: thioesterase [Zetaproteobacteria bacterium CG_4_8_14_3_um_filter_59_5]|nr:MAG: thioesterase [Zetaproteobacteria bacterium CG_4_8_14_3_um_filter_59_5]